MADSEFLKALTSTETIDLTVKDRKSLLGRSSSRPVWFVLENGKLYLVPVTGSDSQWYKKILINPEVQISVKDKKITAKTKPIQGSAEVTDVVQKFRSKYGAAGISKYYSKLDAAVQVLI